MLSSSDANNILAAVNKHKNKSLTGILSSCPPAWHTLGVTEDIWRAFTHPKRAKREDRLFGCGSVTHISLKIILEVSFQAAIRRPMQTRFPLYDRL